MTWRAITAFRLVTAEPAALARFYAALGFTIGERHPVAPAEMAMLGLTGTGTRLPLTLGDQRIDLDRFSVPGRAYPRDANAADLMFQHFALVTRDPAAAWARALAAGATPISRGGPVTLPAASGGVTAAKFRDPDGHPLEFLFFPDNGRGVGGDGVVDRIDHSAISVIDATASIAFYADRGLVVGDETVNHGPAQVVLDGLDDVRVRVVPLQPIVRPPHLELLAYRHPIPRPHPPWSANDIAATRLVWDAGTTGLTRDPDGHLHQYKAGRLLGRPVIRAVGGDPADRRPNRAVTPASDRRSTSRSGASPLAGDPIPRAVGSHPARLATRCPSSSPGDRMRTTRPADPSAPSML